MSLCPLWYHFNYLPIYKRGRLGHAFFILPSIFGGITLGIGVGLIIRYGGSLDGTKIVAIILDKRTGFSIGEIVMFFNIFILSGAGFVFGWDKAMYSLIAYFIAFKVIDVTVTISDVHEVMGGRFKKRAIH